MKTSIVAALAAFLPSVVLASPAPPVLPTVDLGYEIYRANSLNETTGLYNFSNIRYAAPPTGKNRFRAPQPPAQNRSVVQVDRPAPICPQAPPLRIEPTMLEYFNNYTAFGQRSFKPLEFGNFKGSPIHAFDQIEPKNVNVSKMYLERPINPKTTEDCLFLDVVVPEHIFTRRAESRRGAAVLVFIHGGYERSYIVGSKSMPPEGLIARSQEGGSDGIIYVALNYRLGAFGWLSGPTLQKDGTANAGLHDQRFALEWVQKHISKFGGDPDRVTVMGHSAGGGSVMGQITAYGGTKSVPFSQAFVESAGQLPVVGPIQQENIFQDYLQLLNVSSIQEARELSTEELQTANAIGIYATSWGTALYGLASDGDILPALPSQLLAEGRFDKNLKIMASYVASEGAPYANPFIKSGSDLQAFISNAYPTLDQEKLDYIINTLYPPVWDGSQAQGYTNELERAGALILESVFSCNTVHLGKAFGNETYNYVASMYPASHGDDWLRLFGNSKEAMDITLQRYISSFVQKGNPNHEKEPYFPMYGENATVQNINDAVDQAKWNIKAISWLLARRKPLILTPSTGYLPEKGIGPMEDLAANERCNWWQHAFDV